MANSSSIQLAARRVDAFDHVTKRRGGAKGEGEERGEGEREGGG